MYGYLPPKVDFRDYKVCAPATDVEYPKCFSLSNLPKVKDQGEVQSCCAHAASSIAEYFDNNNHSLSTDFIYGIQKSFCGHTSPGMYLKDAAAILLHYGDTLYSDCNGNHEIPECWNNAEKAAKDKSIMDTAYVYHIEGYYSCNSNEDMKYALMHFGPLLSGIYWYSEYSLDKNNVIYFNQKSNQFGHAVVILGWNETGWIVQNSWGESFGDHGRFILPYSYGVMEARALVDYDNSKDVALCKVKYGKGINLLYKVANFFVNIFRSIRLD